MLLPKSSRWRCAVHSVANVGATHFDHVRGAQGMVINGGHRPGGHVYGLADNAAEVFGEERLDQAGTK